MRKPILIAAITSLMMILACVTVNVYFPAAEVQDAADIIVEDIQGGQQPPDEAETAPHESMLRRTLKGISLFEGTAYAQANINITTPNIRALRESMKKRFDSLRPLFDAGVFGETNSGVIAIRSLEGLDLKGKANANKLLKAENADREKLYLEMTKANDLPPDTVSQIRKMFANSWRKNAKAGWLIQNDDGKWVTKGSK